MTANSAAAYIGYEYLEKSVPPSLISFYLDNYPCFGWEEDPNNVTHTVHNKSSGCVTLHFRRNRRICNKAELTRLQRNFDGCLTEIAALERSKSTMALLCALFTGFLGTAFMAGSVFAVSAKPPQIMLCILLAIPAFLGWILPYFLYQSLYRRKAAEVAPFIEVKYDELYAICERGSHLLI
ncbi:MAG: hypothetical protein ACI3U1_01740 [Peptococcaceae bacterium]